MTDIRLSDEEWGKMREFLRQESRAYVGRDEDACRRFVEAVKWMSRSGAQWRLLPTEYDTWLYRERHLVECCFNKLKHFRRIFSRFDKLDRSYLGFVQFVCAPVWLR
jgi:transposase